VAEARVIGWIDRKNRVLAGLVVALALFGWWLHGHGAAPRARALRPLPFEPEAARRLEVENAHGRVAFERRDDAWWIVEPVVYPARHLMVAAMVANLASVRTPDPLPFGATPPAALARAGLDGGAARFAVDAGGATYRGRVGRPGEVGRRTAAAAEERAGVFNLVSRVAALFHGALDDYRDRRALVFAVEEWRVVRFEGPGADAIALARAGAEWRIVEPPVGRPVSRRYAEALVRGLPRLRAVGFAREALDPATTGLDPARARRVTVVFDSEGDERRDVLFLGAPRDADTRFARRLALEAVFWVDEREVEAIWPASVEAIAEAR